MADDPLIPTAELAARETEVRRRAGGLEPPLAVDLDDAGYGGAFTRYLLFEEWPQLAGREISAETAFYNRYFWLRRAATLYQQRHGPDAGMEQMVFQLTEGADFEIDWELLEALDRRAREGREP